MISRSASGGSHGRPGLEDSSLIARKIFSQKQIFVASPEYLRKTARPETLAGLSGHRIIKQVSGAWGSVTDLLVDGSVASHRLDEAFVLNSPNAAHRAVLAGGGIGLVASYLVSEDLASGRLVRILPSVETQEQPIFAVYPHRTHVPAKTRLFIDFLSEELGMDPSA